MERDLQQLTNDELQTILDEHDCHVFEMDGCECAGIYDELRKRYNAGDCSWEPAIIL